MDAELLEAAKRDVARQHGIPQEFAYRLVGSDARSLHEDAKALARELNVVDPSERTRDDAGRFTDADGKVDVNRMIRAAAGR